MTAKAEGKPKENRGLSSKSANVLLLITSLIWGGGFIATDIALTEGISPLQIIAGRMLVASIGLDIVFFKRVVTLKKEEIIAGAIMGICLFGGFFFQTVGLVYTTPAINAFVTAIYVVMIPFINWGLTKKRPDKFSNISALLTVVGIGLISMNSGFYISLGIPLTLICAVFYAFELIFADCYSKQYDPVKLTVVMINFNLILSAVLVVGMAVVAKDLPVLTMTGVGGVVYLGLFSTFVAFLCQNIGQKYTSAVKAGIIMSTESVFGAIFSALIFKEVFTVRMIIGCGLIFAAIIISETKMEFIRNKEKL